ncbi:hypothetical protein HPP92_012682 [Vanilla planifolia]|uniref:Uncharacterized protein n=1 Tax=Vanilla planifolia TaxID=51239 RepID=A0A835UXX1_VANPL|nr:hypothetical protein HPP92_012682 [Vanilla planifolia]
MAEEQWWSILMVADGGGGKQGGLETKEEKFDLGESAQDKFKHLNIRGWGIWRLMWRSHQASPPCVN